MVLAMALLEQWRSVAYNENLDRNRLQKLWGAYFKEEKDIYAELLKNPDYKAALDKYR